MNSQSISSLTIRLSITIALTLFGMSAPRVFASDHASQCDSRRSEIKNTLLTETYGDLREQFELLYLKSLKENKIEIMQSLSKSDLAKDQVKMQKVVSELLTSTFKNANITKPNVTEADKLWDTFAVLENDKNTGQRYVGYSSDSKGLIAEVRKLSQQSDETGGLIKQRFSWHPGESFYELNESLLFPRNAETCHSFDCQAFSRDDGSPRLILCSQVEREDDLFHLVEKRLPKDCQLLRHDANPEFKTHLYMDEAEVREFNKIPLPKNVQKISVVTETLSTTPPSPEDDIIHGAD